MKRFLDILVSALAIVVTSPLWFTIVVVLGVSGHRPILFRQERIGKGGRPFHILKFRTMVVDSESDGVPQLAEADDDRLTRPGRWLRAHHLDELPQLWNVLCGDMSFIGYRPERKYFIDQIMEHDSRYALLYKIRPGVTSYATLYNGYTDTMEKMLRRLELDLYYLEHQSLWFDTRIFFLTLLKVICGKRF